MNVLTSKYEVAVDDDDAASDSAEGLACGGGFDGVGVGQGGGGAGDSGAKFLEEAGPNRPPAGHLESEISGFGGEDGEAVADRQDAAVAVEDGNFEAKFGPGRTGRGNSEMQIDQVVPDGSSGTRLGSLSDFVTGDGLGRKRSESLGVADESRLHEKSAVPPLVEPEIAAVRNFKQIVTLHAFGLLLLCGTRQGARHGHATNGVC